MLTTDYKKEYEQQNKASVLILAGGNSTRANTNKLLLEINNTKLIQYIKDQIKPYFEDILISTNDSSLYTFLGEKIIPDIEPGHGPLMGILSGLIAAKHKKMFVLAGDIPQVNIKIMNQMISLADEYDYVIPVIESNKYEPLFAVYTKEMEMPIRKMLDSGDRKIMNIIEKVNHYNLQINDTDWYWNLNTLDSYNDFIKWNKKDNSK